MDIRDPSIADNIRNGLILGSSTFLHFAFKNTRDGKPTGVALLHNCLTNRPFLTGLEPFEEIAASAGLDSGCIMLIPPRRLRVPRC